MPPAARFLSITGRFLATVEEFNLLPRGARVLAAVSGGPDSVCLLDLLQVAGPRLGFELEAFHLNHRLRPSAARDEAFVRKVCRTWGIALTVARQDTAAYAQRTGLGIEEAGRVLRYRQLERAADRLGCDRIALGHTADDNLETMLMNICRGAGPRGVAGIPVRRGRIIRPLLDIERSDIVRYLRSRALDWVEDETNADVSFRRNLVRQQVVPLLRRLNPATVANSRRCARLLAAEDEFMTELAERALKESVNVIRGRALIDTGKLRQYNHCLQRRIVRMLQPELDAEGVERVLEFMMRAGTGRMATGQAELRRRNGAVEMVVRRKGRTRRRTCRETDS